MSRALAIPAALFVLAPLAWSEDLPFRDKVLEAAEKYASWSKVDDLARWAPALCMAPRPPEARLSRSDDEKTHGKKLYFLYASRRDLYVNLAKVEGELPAGTTIVKESFEVEPGKDGARPRPGKRSALYVMLKLDRATEGTDKGWVYATLTPDGKQVTSSGKLESCMKCHVKAKHERLFGLADDAPAGE